MLFDTNANFFHLFINKIMQPLTPQIYQELLKDYDQLNDTLEVIHQTEKVLQTPVNYQYKPYRTLRNY